MIEGDDYTIAINITSEKLFIDILKDHDIIYEGLTNFDSPLFIYKNELWKRRHYERIGDNHYIRLTRYNGKSYKKRVYDQDTDYIKTYI